MDCVTAENPPIRKRTSPRAETFAWFKTELDPTGKKQQAAVIEQFLT